MNITRNRLVVGLLVAVGAVASIAFASTSNATIFNSPDCSSNSIIKCGAMTQAELRAKYNASPELKALYGHFGVTNAHIQGALHTGTVYKDGRVVLNGKVVATNAQSVGRTDKPNSVDTPFTVNGVKYYKGATSERFGYEGEVAYIMLNSNGQFAGAIVKGCGNPIPATPVKPPEPPKPTPVYSCNAITKKQISRDNYEFNANTTAKNGAVNKDYTYNFGDGSSKTVTSGPVQHTYAKAGTYTVTLTPTFVVNGKVVTATSAACKTTVTVTEVPPTPAYACKALTAAPVVEAAGKVVKYNFAASATATGGAVVKNYTYNFGDGTAPVTSGATTSHTYAKAGTYTATVSVNVTVNGQTKTVTSQGCKVTVKVTIPVVKPAEVKCTALTLQKISDTTYNLRASASASAASDTQKPGVITGYTYTVKNASGAVVKTIEKQTANKTSESGNITLQPGSYVAQVVVHSNVGNKTGEQCIVRFAIPTPEEIQVCRLSDYEIVTILKKDFDATKHSKNLADCTEKVCELATKTIITINKKDFDASKHSRNEADCKEVETPMCEVPGKEHLPVDSPECVETPVTPPVTPPTPPVTELPVTGAGDAVLSLIGAGSLIAAASYYVASRRAING